MELNKVILAGRLTADPELMTLPSGDFLTEIRVASNRRWKDPQTREAREDVCFVDVKAFGARAELVHKFFKRGRQIVIEGRLKQERWERDGQARSKHVIVLEDFSFVDPKPKDEDGAGSPEVPAYTHDEPGSNAPGEVARPGAADLASARPGAADLASARPGAADLASARPEPADLASARPGSADLASDALTPTLVGEPAPARRRRRERPVAVAGNAPAGDLSF